jgi:hypothetical protein
MINQCEPTLEELLDEPIIQQVMRSDGVEADDVRFLMQAAGILRSRREDAPPTITRHPQFVMFGCTASAC